MAVILTKSVSRTVVAEVKEMRSVEVGDSPHATGNDPHRRQGHLRRRRFSGDEEVSALAHSAPHGGESGLGWPRRGC